MEYLLHAATHDSLTGLPNRALFLDRLEQALRHAKRTGERFVVALLDMDRFKTVNDALGHQTGDVLLREVAARLRGSVREEDTVARIGGDEFAMVLPGIKNTEVAVRILAKITGFFATPIPVGNLMLRSSVSLGGCLWTGSCSDAQDLLALADQAMYRAKRAGGNAFLLKTMPNVLAGEPFAAVSHRGSHEIREDPPHGVALLQHWTSIHGDRIRPRRAGYFCLPQIPCQNSPIRTRRVRGGTLAISSRHSLSNANSSDTRHVSAGELHAARSAWAQPKGIRVLFVSDDSAVRNATQLFLRVSGYDARAVSSAEAMAEASDYALDLIVADYCLHRPITGVDVITSLGAVEGSRIKALLLTYDPCLAASLSKHTQNALVAERPFCGDGLLRLLAQAAHKT